MTETEHLLVCAAEEAAEIAQAVAKALKFGLDDQDPWSQTNRKKIAKEYGELREVMKMLEESHILQHLEVPEKRERLLVMMEYARDRGTLS